METKSRVGQLTVDQMEEVLKLIPVLEVQRKELVGLFSVGSKKSAEMLAPGLAWADLYQIPFEKMIEYYLDVSSLRKFALDISRSADPYEELKKLDSHPDYQDWNGGTDGLYGPQHLVGILFCICASLESLLLYGEYVSNLLANFLNQSDDHSLFKAVRIDPSVITTRVVSQRVALAVATGDGIFFRNLQNAFKGKTGKQARYLKKFRFLMQVLTDQGQQDLPAAEIRALAIHLDAYADTSGAEKNLTELIRKFRKNKTISK